MAELSSPCSCCEICSDKNKTGPIDKMIEDKGMAIIQVIDDEAPPFYYSVGNAESNETGFEFLIAGIDADIADSTISILVELSKTNPELFLENRTIENVLTIQKDGLKVKAPVYIRLITDEAYENMCGQIISRHSERIKVFQIFIPDKDGLAFNDPNYDKMLAKIQCPFISNPSI
jgi:hypothetical protein